MTINKARKILREAGITWGSYFDLEAVESNCEEVKLAIERVMTFLSVGK